jgi:integral membrane sensor signal transduction histidine kinase
MEDDPSTGAALLPVLQILSLVCLAFSGLQFLFEFEVPRRGVWAGYVLATAGVVGIMWMARRRAAPGRARAACSVVVLVLLTGPALLGTISFVVPVLIVAAALLVIDIGVRASLAGDAVASAALAALFPVLGGGGPREILLFAIPMAVLMSVGTALGLALSRYDAALVAQGRAIVERDAALEEVRRRAVLEKELMLARERARAAHELHDGLGHRLTRIGMSLEFAGRVRHSDPVAAWEEVAVAERTSREAVREMRTWVRALSPVRAEGDRGVAGLEDVAASFRGTGVRVRVTDELSPRSPTEAAELLVYRTVQEGLTNALRHSRARSVSIRVAATDQGILVSVTNEIPAERLGSIPRAPVGEGSGASAGFGLGGLSERAAELGGALTAGRDGDSFRLTLTLPPREIATAIDEGAS